VRVVVVVVVNSLGVIVDRAGRVVRGNRDPDTGERSYMAMDDMAFGHQRQLEHFGARVPEATTLTVVITDAKLRRDDQAQLARQIHVSMARAIASELAWDAVLSAVSDDAKTDEPGR
jgi:L-aminopeptidase/D-esterase-like protein